MDELLNRGVVAETPPDALDVFEIRVLAVLAEKEMLTPDNYPLSLNALVNGCNQLSSRDPVMSISESTVQEVLQRLMQKKFAAEVRQAGARVSKYEHRLRMVWLLEQDKLAILTQLMLRGVQTAGEIRHPHIENPIRESREDFSHKFPAERLMDLDHGTALLASTHVDIEVFL